MLVSAQRSSSLQPQKNKATGGCGDDKVTQESIGSGSLPTPQPPLQHGSHRVPEQCRGGEDGSGQAL